MKSKKFRFEQIDLTEYHWQGPRKVGTLGWDSEPGQLSGTLAEKVKSEALHAKLLGFASTIHPIPGGFRVSIKDPLARARRVSGHHRIARIGRAGSAVDLLRAEDPASDIRA